MEHIFKNSSFFFLCLFIFILGLGASAVADDEIGKVVFVRGEATLQSVDDQEPHEASFDEAVQAMDTLETKDGELKVIFNDQTVLSLAPFSKVLITEHVYKPAQGVRRSLFDILQGSVRTIVEQTVSYQENDVRLQTPTAVAGIRGTDVGTKVTGKTTQFACFSGAFEAYLRNDPTKKVMVRAGQFTHVQDAVPTKPKPIPPSLNKDFSAQMAPPPLQDVLRQPGGEKLGPPPRPEGPPPRGLLLGGMPPPPPPGPPPPGQEQGPKPPLPPLLPGGQPFTPPEAVNQPTGPSSGSGKSRVNVPVHFPGGVQ